MKMTSAFEFPDEFEEFRARSYSGGYKQAMTSREDNDKSYSSHVQSKDGKRSPCPAEFDTSDSEDERTVLRVMNVGCRNKGNRSPSPSLRPMNCNRGTPGLKVPRPSRARSVSPQSSIMSARSRARLKVEELRRMMARKSEDSLDEYPKNNESGINKSPGQRRRVSGGHECRSDSGISTNRNNQTECSNVSPLDTRFLSHMSCVILDADDEIGDIRPRVSTEPTRTLSRGSFRSKVPSTSDGVKGKVRLVHTVRHFTITSKGSVVSQGEYLSKSSTSVGSYESGSTTCSAASDNCEYYTVLFVGDPGVGKRALIEKFLPQEATSALQIVGK